MSQHWGRWIQREALAFTFRPASLPPEKRIVLLDHPGDEGMFRWGTLSPEADSRDLLPLKVLEQYLILSLPGWARDLSSEAQIRASARMAIRRMPGYLQLSIQARPEQLVPYFNRFTATVLSLQEGRLDVGRFQEAKRLVYLEFRQALEDPEARLYRLLETDLYRWGINYVVYFGLRVDRVTPEVFREAVSQYLPLDRSVLVVAGPAADLRPSLESLGQIQVAP